MLDRPLLYDLYCGAGGATKGYQRAGFRVIGIDVNPQPHYCGDGFIQTDALEFIERYLAGEFERAAAFHASPPCQRYSNCTPKGYHENHPDLIAPTRNALLKTGKPYVIENVSGARRELRSPIMLCGSMFGLRSFRHRFFEAPDIFILTPSCRHDFRPLLVTTAGSNSIAIRERPFKSVTHAVAAYGIDWMTCDELKETFPPAYTQFIGERLIEYLRQSSAA